MGQRDHFYIRARNGMDWSSQICDAIAVHTDILAAEPLQSA